MEKKDAYPFLLRVTIPEVKAKLPRALRGGKKGNLVWDAIWRAHRDVVLGRQYVESYAAFGRESREGEDMEPNIIPTRLYEIIVEEMTGQPLSSEVLIGRLGESLPFEGSSENVVEAIGFGPLQKLVNMSLKYLVLLQTFGVHDDVLDRLLPIDVEACDCPIDSTIIKNLPREFAALRWTQLELEDYRDLQAAIRKQSPDKSGLYFDFQNWQHLDIDALRQEEA